MTSGADARLPMLDHRRDSRQVAATNHAVTLDPPRARVPGHAKSRDHLIAIALGMIVGLGFMLRLFGATQMSPHVDEPASILAAHAAAERGLPILPSGTPYFQGATLSYLLVPFVWLGFGDLDNLALMRLVPVAAGTLAVFLGYGLGRYVTGNPWIGAAMAALVAIDPISVQWSGHVRMYALLQVLTVGLAWAFIHLLMRGPSKRRVATVVALFWLAVFTHVGATLLLPAMLLTVVVLTRRGLVPRNGFLTLFTLCGMAPLLLLLLNRMLGVTSGDLGESSRGPAIPFVGDNLIAPLARFQVSPAEWELNALAKPSTLFWLIPGLIVAICSVITARRYLLNRNCAASAETRIGCTVCFIMYWLPTLTVALLTASPKPRYLLHVHVLGYLFVAVLLSRLTRAHWCERAGRRNVVGSALACSAIVIVLAGIGGGLVWRLQHLVVHPDYHTAMAYAASNHSPGQPVIVALPPVAYLAMDAADRDDLYFLAGSRQSTRAERYTLATEDGRIVDYWVGAESVVTAQGLRSILLENPDSLLVIDEHRLTAEWAYGGKMEDVIREMTTVVHRGPGGALVLTPSEGGKSTTRDRDLFFQSGGEQGPGAIGSPCMPARSSRVCGGQA
ncbi:MAG TPA: hypothetical protein VGR29_11350 [Thermomicrobiales bacterium]|nr:hypothetical protein [Thermomicrobiales bacterium]